MSKQSLPVCPDCGARLAEDAEICDLCGLPIGEDAISVAESHPSEAFESEDIVASETPVVEAEAAGHRSIAGDRPATPSGVYCNECGWRNPMGARFCSMCGTRIQDVTAAPEMPVHPSPRHKPSAAQRAAPFDPPETTVVTGLADTEAADTERKAVTRQVGIIVGAGVLLVVVLFLITAISKNQPAPESAAAVITPPPIPPIDTGTATPLPPQLAEQTAALETEIEQLEGVAKLAKQRELANLFIGGGRLDRAALVQQQIAEVQNTPEEWKRAGDLFYDWMSTLQDQAKPPVAQQAIAAYQRVLDAEPDNHDVRTDMATAYLSSNNPMQGVQEIKRVLEADPDHLHARFNYGIMLALIGRRDQAAEQFETVKTLVGPESSYYQQAEEAIRSLQQGGSL